MNRKTHSHYYVQVSSVNYFLICSALFAVCSLHFFMFTIVGWLVVCVCVFSFSLSLPIYLFLLFAAILFSFRCTSSSQFPCFVAISFPTSLHNLISLPRMLQHEFLLLLNLSSASIRHLSRSPFRCSFILSLWVRCICAILVLDFVLYVCIVNKAHIKLSCQLFDRELTHAHNRTTSISNC